MKIRVRGTGEIIERDARTLFLLNQASPGEYEIMTEVAPDPVPPAPAEATEKPKVARRGKRS